MWQKLLESNLHDSVTRRYQSKVQTGNWFEQQIMEKIKANEFRTQIKSNALNVQKLDTVHNLFKQPVVLGSTGLVVRFGSSVQLIPSKLKLCAKNTKVIYPALSIAVGERALKNASHKKINQWDVAVAPTTEGNLHSAFKIVSADDQCREGEPLKYEQTFRLESEIPSPRKVFLYSAPRAAGLSFMFPVTACSTKIGGELNQPLGLTWEDSCGPGKMFPKAYMQFFCCAAHPRQRLRFDGTEVVYNSPLQIKHMATNKSISTEEPVLASNIYNFEYLVAVQNYDGKHLWKNEWILHNGDKSGLTNIASMQVERV